MARNTTVVVALLMVIGCVVALLPAEETSRRRSSVYNVTSEDSASASQPTGQPRLLPGEPSPAAPGELKSAPTGVSPAGGPRSPAPPRRPAGLTGQLQASSETAASEYSASAPTPATSPNSPVAEPAPLYQPGAGSLQQLPIGDETAAAEAAAANDAPLPPSEIAGTRSILKRAPSGIADPSTPPPSSLTTPPSITPPHNIPPNSDAPSVTSAKKSAGATTPPARTASRPRTVSSSPGSSGSSDATLSSRSPSLKVDLTGPAAITVGKPASYGVTLVNDGDVAAHEVQVRLALPGHATVSGGQATAGEARLQATPTGQSHMVWNVPQVGPHETATLNLVLVAREGRRFDLGVEWTCRPSSTIAPITVKQAQLRVELAGPGDMTFGEEKPFTLSISNPGNGDAENVVVALSSGQGRPQQIEVGTVPAGERKDVQVQVLASEAGEMPLRAVATGDNELQADAVGKVVVRKAELNVAVEGPELKFAGAEAAYALTIQNTGTAAADNVNFTLALPAGAKYVGGLDGAAAAAGGLKWKLSSLPAGMQKTFEVRLQLNSAGVNAIALQAQATAGIAASGTAETTVEATADLKLVVNDPAGPLSTTEDAIYELQVMNRGSDAADQVKIVMQFGDGIEPVAFEGCEARIVPGQVVCQPLSELGVGEQVTLRVKARATKGGSHQFRVEVTSTDAQTRLVSEGTTRFFSETGRTGAAASTARKPAAVSGSTPGTIQR